MMREDIYRWICEGLFVVIVIFLILAMLGFKHLLLTVAFIVVLLAFGVFFKLLDNEVCKRTKNEE